MELLAAYSADARVEMWDTGVEALNKLWGGGADSQGMYGIWGPQGSGKTTLLLQCFKKLCKDGKTCVFLDVEKAFNEKQQKAFGLYEYVVSGKLIVLTCSNYEEFENIFEQICELEDVALFGVDSETMLQPVASRDVRVTDNQPGMKAKQASFCLTKMKPLFYKAKITVILLFHARANLDMNGGTVDPLKQAGGYAQLHIPDVLMKVTPGAKVYESDSKSPQIGQIIKLECTKNKYTAPFVKLEKKLIYGTGISKKIDLIDTAIEAGVIVQGGGGYYKLPSGGTVRGTKALYELPNAELTAIKDAINKQ